MSQTNVLLENICKLLQDMPRAICDEMQRREILMSEIKKKQLQEHMNFLHEHNIEINKMMFGGAPIKVIPDDEKDKQVAQQLENTYNHIYTKDRK